MGNLETIGNIELIAPVWHHEALTVYKGRQMQSAQIVRVTVLQPETHVVESAAAQFSKVTKKTASLKHPNVLSAIAQGRENDLLYCTTNG